MKSDNTQHKGRMCKGLRGPGSCALFSGICSLLQLLLEFPFFIVVNICVCAHVCNKNPQFAFLADALSFSLIPCTRHMWSLLQGSMWFFSDKNCKPQNLPEGFKDVLSAKNYSHILNFSTVLEQIICNVQFHRINNHI